MKKTYSLLAPNTKVFAVSRIHKNNIPTDNLAIYEAIVSSVYVSYDKDNNCDSVDYGLTTPDGQDWGGEVKSTEISESFEELVNVIRKEWSKNSNSFGE